MIARKNDTKTIFGKSDERIAHIIRRSQLRTFLHRDNRVNDSAKQIEHAFQIALGRPPSSDELAELTTLAGSDVSGLDAVCRVLLNSNEFIYVD